MLLFSSSNQLVEIHVHEFEYKRQPASLLVAVQAAYLNYFLGIKVNKALLENFFELNYIVVRI